MSLLLDALRARKAKEEGQSVEPVEFSGPVINADEVLGRSDAVPALEPAHEPALKNALEPAVKNAVEYESAGSRLENSTPGSSDLPDSVALSQSVSGQFTTVSESAKHDGNDKSAEIPLTDIDDNSINSIDDGDTEFVTTSHNVETAVERDTTASSPDELSIQFERERIVKHQGGVDTGVSEPASGQTGSTGTQGTQADQQVRPQVRPQVAAETLPGRSSGAAIAIARSMNPDPLFFVIIAFAFAGLFGSLYALVTQNDAFVSKEYTELKARQSALNELMADQQGKDQARGEQADSVAEALLAPASAEQYSQSHNGTAEASNEASTLAASEAGLDDGLEASGTTPVSASSANVANSSEDETDKVEAANSVVVRTPDNALDNALDNAPGNDLNSVSVPSPATAVTQVGIEDLAALQAELNELRASLAAQSLRISEVLAENSELRQSRLESIDQPSSTPVAAGNLEGDESGGPAAKASAVAYDKASEVTIAEVADTGLETDLSMQKNIVATAATNSQNTTRPGLSPQGSHAQDKGQLHTHAQGRSQADTHGHAKGGANSDDQATDFSSIIGKAFHAYSIDNLSEAVALYTRALQLEPYNRDANLGVAAVAMKTGNYPVARVRYQQLLSLDPVDVVAFSALLNLAAATRDPVIENEMVQHSFQHRDSPALHAVLGNYYSQTARWVMASRSYAAAVGLSPDTADYLYNLAVTLDNLGDSQAAIETYERALALSETGFFTFSVMDATARLQVLQGS